MTFSESAKKTHERLEKEAWATAPDFIKLLEKAQAKLQRLKDGFGETVRDEYSFVVDRMANDVKPESIIVSLAKDMNETVNNESFNRLCEFDKLSSDPALGAVIHIDIIGPDNGSVIISEISPSAFTLSTIEIEKTGSHPENGSREFGFEVNSDQSILFYTRGVSRPNTAIGKVGDPLQRQTWTSLLEGLSKALELKGCAIRPASLRIEVSP
ncbi:hypothetical protein H6F93_00280 [Leptolyngbya sp. FACHB-671]|uniref:hypothetical protein n=1 Tax=Leptolyngbya sp. FACHB-671 TaxID=2692812 RepID=UPI0016864F3C|nr:hypothetical protein [Leptolyngbya sp. FACHB-671]MBD2065990.1 hypothetical protein [Leptolyngbya sp. FACHB-671]